MQSNCPLLLSSAPTLTGWLPAASAPALSFGAAPASGAAAAAPATSAPAASTPPFSLGGATQAATTPGSAPGSAPAFTFPAAASSGAAVPASTAAAGVWVASCVLARRPGQALLVSSCRGAPHGNIPLSLGMGMLRSSMMGQASEPGTWWYMHALHPSMHLLYAAGAASSAAAPAVSFGFGAASAPATSAAPAAAAASTPAATGTAAPAAASSAAAGTPSIAALQVWLGQGLFARVFSHGVTAHLLEGQCRLCAAWRDEYWARQVL
jgi:hypothetical protein